MLLHLIQILVIRPELCEILVLAECVRYVKRCFPLPVPDHLPLSGSDLCTWTSLSSLRPLPYQKGRFSFLRIYHFAFPSIPGRRRHASLLGRRISGITKGICIVHRIEFVNDLSCLLHHRHLVLTSRNHVRLESCDIGSLTDRIGKEPTGMLASKFLIWISLFTVGFSAVWKP